MAFTYYPATNKIWIPQTDLTHITGTIYEFDVEQFHFDLRAWEATFVGMCFLNTHLHNTTVTVAGVTYARAVVIIDPYSIEFEDGNYTVRLVNANNNVFDVLNGILVQNQVQIISTNSAGLIIHTSGSGLSTEEHDQLMQIENPPSQTLNDYKADVATIESAMVIVRKLTGNKVTRSGDIITIYEDDEVTPWKQFDLASGGRVEV